VQAFWSKITENKNRSSSVSPVEADEDMIGIHKERKRINERQTETLTQTLIQT